MKGWKGMKKIIICRTLLFLFILTGCAEKEAMKNIEDIHASPKIYDITMKRDALCLMMAYPEYITNVKKMENGNVYLVMKSGKRILYDDKKKKSFKEKLENTDLQDMMEQIYPLEDSDHLMPEEFDPGRFREYNLLKEVYGISKEQVQSNLVNVKIHYKNYSFNNNNKAAQALQRAINELQTQQSIYSQAFPINGTFNYRFIAGTNRLSIHSFGIGIDLKSDKRDYWKWTSREDGQKRLIAYPREIVQVFEKNNFIWGGKWGHFDILHFEYRPELLFKSKYFSDKPDLKKPWHSGAPSKDPMVKKYIEIIEKEWK